MNIHDWALVIYTILVQMAVGSFIVLGLMHYLARAKSGQEQADKLSNRALLAIGPVLVLGTIASLLHLGSPLDSFRAISNLGSSWLSREIAFTVAFIIVGAVFAFMQWRKISTSNIRNLVALVAVVLGLGLVYSMTRIYMQRTTPSWDTIATPISFFTTTFLLGVLAIGAAFFANYAYLESKKSDDAGTQKELLRASLQVIAVMAVVLVGIHLVVTPLTIAYLANSDAVAAVESANTMIEDYGILLALRLVLAFLGAGIAGAFMYGSTTSPGRERFAGMLAASAFILVLVAEIMGRFLFYITKTTVGL